MRLGGGVQPYTWLERRTFAAVAHVEAAGQHVAGLVAELVGQPGVGAALVAVGHGAQTAGELPGLSAGPARPAQPGHAREPAVAPGTWGGSEVRGSGLEHVPPQHNTTQHTTNKQGPRQ